MKRLAILFFVLLGVACQPASNGGKTYASINTPTQGAQNGVPATAADALPSGEKPVTPPLPSEAAPPASKRGDLARGQELPKLINQFFDGNATSRVYIQADKPLYRPGETIWFKAWDLKTPTLVGANNAQTIVDLISPKGASVLKKRLHAVNGSAAGEFDLPDGVRGGEYTLRATAADGVSAERALIVSAYQPPRLKKKLEFIKKAYGAGDLVSATVEAKRGTGEPLAGKQLTAVITLDGAELLRVTVTTNADGSALVKFKLPQTIIVGDGLLTILVEDGGITESISKAIPIVLKKLSLAFLPEGGKMVASLPTRLYFEAKTPLGKPADVEGRLVDELGNAVGTFSSYKNGLGRIEFTPATGRRYHAEVTRPLGVTEKYALPLVEEKGCVMRTYDDFDGQAKALRVAVRCSERQQVVVAASVRENLLDSGVIEANADQPGVIYLAAQDAAIGQAAGVARVTVFDANLHPLAERLVFRNRRARLDVRVEPDKTSYAPRGEVGLTITTRDASGKVVPAELALAVVDDSVIAFADDKSSHLVSKLLLASELSGKIEEPNFYVDLTEPKSALALDLLMGARGYRRFHWSAVTEPQPLPVMSFNEAVQAPLRQGAAPRAALPPPKLRAVPPDDNKVAAQADAIAAEPARGQAQPGGRLRADVAPALETADQDFANAAEKNDGKKGKRAMPVRDALFFTVARVFPVPTYDPHYAGARDDFRETVFWAPMIATDKDGRAQVKFTLSDAITSFRVFAEGMGGGAVGRSETVLKSSLPFSLDVKLPLEVSAGDQLLIPLTLSNESASAQQVDLHTSFGALMQATSAPAQGGTLAAGQRKSVFIPLTVTGVRGQSEVRIGAAAAGLNDEVVRMIPVTPVGFPRVFEQSGQVKGRVSHEVDLSGATPGSAEATVKVYTSALSIMISGLDGMLREPGGCFEQTSSTNYPNIMILQYMRQHDVADPVLLEKSGRYIDNGYKLLTGFEAPKKGFEWFGADPGHEALTAYGLLEFIDMQDVYGAVDSAMLARTSAWLKSRRDGKGGYLRDPKALDSFGRATSDVTDAYITWALVSAGQAGLDKEIEKTMQLAVTTQDAYQLALAAGSLLHKNGGHQNARTLKAGQAAAAKLAKMQSASGVWDNAKQSITMSGGSNLQIEATSLAILALLRADGYADQVRKGVTWLNAHRGGFGQWGATQATVLALKAMNAYDAATRIAPMPGKVTLLVDGVVAGEVSYDAGRREPIVFTGFDDKLTPGKHSMSIKSSSSTALPYSMAVEYRNAKPASAATATVKLTATLAKTALNMGETVRMDAVITNKLASGQPMTLARLGVPGGLTFQNWQLKALREKGEIAFFETRAREVILYFRDMRPGEVKKIGIDLVASVPGTYTGPTSSAYLYYNDTDKSWAAPLVVTITP
jgi:hypothetical protein